jgi:hypothetical protein
MADTKTILIWGNEDVLSSSIGLILDARENWKVVNLSSTVDVDTLIKTVDETQPDIIIFNRTCHNNRNSLPLQFLKDHPGVKVITVNLEDNALEVYSKKKIIVKQVSDLISELENEQ